MNQSIKMRFVRTHNQPKAAQMMRVGRHEIAGIMA